MKGKGKEGLLAAGSTVDSRLQLSCLMSDELMSQAAKTSQNSFFFFTVS